jgi:predicted NBD/HSP70 family sugar kinase
MEIKRKGENQTLVRRYNQKMILEEIIAKNTLSRAQLSKSLNLSAPSVSSNVESLIEVGILKETGRGSSTSGRKPILLKFNQEYGYVIGIDLSKGRIIAAIGDLSGKINHRYKGAKAGNKIGVDLIELIVQEINKCLKQTTIPISKILAVAIASPGIMTPEKHVRLDPQQLNWNNLPAEDILTEKLGRQVIIENDINVAALGEHGLHPSVEQLIFVSVGRGLGSGIIMNGELYKGAFGGAGEIALMGIESHAEEDIQYTESLVSIETLRNELYKAALISSDEKKNWDDEELLQYTLEQLKAENGDVHRIIHRMAKFLSIIIGNLAAVLNPQLIVISGEMMSLADYFLPVIIKHIKKVHPFPTEIRLSEIRNEVGLMGSIGLAKNFAIDQFTK